ncbi:MAG: hypothetical protein MJZ68_03445 [archaeon]|nr:hypothetical protein [archaeon]
MTDSEREIRDLRMEVETLRNEVNELKEYVKILYSLLNEEEGYEASPDFTGGVEFGRANT